MAINNLENETDLTQAEYYMQECFDLAKKGLGRTSPNPVVGAIVLDKNGLPVGKGFHKKAGEEHAEVIAIKEAGEKVKGGTLIVNLEPCCYTGKTPPCSDLIIKSKIEQVIFSNYDLNPQVSGNGEKKLLANNIKVISKVLEKEGLELNRFFFKWIKTKEPWIALKQAQTLDGKIALKNKESKWITGEIARREVHYVRNIFDAVLVHASTVEIDNPELTVRDLGESRNPIRIILDPELKTNEKANVYKKNSQVILVTKKGHSKEKVQKYLSINSEITFLELPETNKNKVDLKNFFLELGKKEILSVLIEAGPGLAGELLKKKLIDEYLLFISPIVFGDKESFSSVNSGELNKIESSFRFNIFSHKIIGNDLMLSLRPLNNKIRS